MTTFFISDMHFGHSNIIEYSDRPFKDLDEMAKAIINNCNNVVNHDDLLYIAGDAVMGVRHKNLPVMHHLHGFKVLFPGNHDDCHPMYSEKKNFTEKVELYKQYFDDILDASQPHPVEDHYLLSHFPYNFEEEDYIGRDFSKWEPKDEGKILLHGHVHNTWKYKLSDLGTPMINVGVDVWDFTPVSMDQIEALIREKM